MGRWRMRLLAGDRFGAAALGVSLLVAACSSTPSTADGPTTPAASPTARPPTNVTIVPLTTSEAGDFVRPRPPGAFEGELSDATPDAERCPDPFPEDHDLHGSETIRLPHAESEDVPPPAPLDVPPLVHDDDLGDQIADVLGDDAGRYAVIIKDLRDGRGVAINEDRLFYAASLFKLEVMYEIFHQREAGLIAFDERYAASDYYASFGLGPHLIAQCDEVTIEQALGAMMSVSDNVAAVMLQDRAGPRNINNAMSALGLRATALLPENTLPTTAADLALLLEAIARGDAVSEDASRQMADLMATEELDDRIPAAVPDDTLVAHKTGNWTNATHDAGIVYGERSTYIVVLMSDIGFDGDAGSVEREIMELTWAYLEGDSAE